MALPFVKYTPEIEAGDPDFDAGRPDGPCPGDLRHAGVHDALVLFSNGSPHAAADAGLGVALGIGLRIFSIDGPTLLEDEPDSGTYHYVNINYPVFLTNNVEHYVLSRTCSCGPGTTSATAAWAGSHPPRIPCSCTSQNMRTRCLITSPGRGPWRNLTATSPMSMPFPVPGSRDGWCLS